VLLLPVQPDREKEKGPHDFVQTFQPDQECPESILRVHAREKYQPNLPVIMPACTSGIRRLEAESIRRDRGLPAGAIVLHENRAQL
jgi:hypothetical protein